MSRVDWFGIGLAVFFSCIGIGYVLETMAKNDRYSACAQRGGNMVKVGNGYYCDLSGGKHGRQ